MTDFLKLDSRERNLKNDRKASTRELRSKTRRDETISNNVFKLSMVFYASAIILTGLFVYFSDEVIVIRPKERENLKIGASILKVKLYNVSYDLKLKYECFHCGSKNDTQDCLNIPLDFYKPYKVDCYDMSHFELSGEYV
jgi:hypothetical protein